MNLIDTPLQHCWESMCLTSASHWHGLLEALPGSFVTELYPIWNKFSLWGSVDFILKKYFHSNKSFLGYTFGVRHSLRESCLLGRLLLFCQHQNVWEAYGFRGPDNVLGFMSSSLSFLILLLASSLRTRLYAFSACWEVKCLLLPEWLKKMWYTYTMEGYLDIKKEILSFVTVWMNLEDVTLSEIC